MLSARQQLFFSIVYPSHKARDIGEKSVWFLLSYDSYLYLKHFLQTMSLFLTPPGMLWSTGEEGVGNERVGERGGQDGSLFTLSCCEAQGEHKIDDAPRVYGKISVWKAPQEAW